MPMRVIAKKRCRAMFEPPEKGKRATLNPNLSTRLNLLFSDQALGRRVGYCWSRRASVPRLIFNAKTLKLRSSRPKPNKPRRLDTLSNVPSDVRVGSIATF
jgi:hypothetical protein